MAPPIYRPPQADNGYDMSVYQNIDPLFGSLEEFDSVPLQFADLKHSLGRWQTGLAAAGWNSFYFSNHDQPRSVSRFGEDGQFRYESATLLATILRRGSSIVTLGGETLVVVGNFSSEPLELPLAVAGDLVIGDLVIGNCGEVADVAGHCSRGTCGWFGRANAHAQTCSRCRQNYFCTTSEPAMRWAT